MLLFGLAMVLIMIWKPRGLISTRDAFGLPERAQGDPSRPRERGPRMTPAPRDILLRVEHLTMRFGGLVAVEDLSF